MNQKRIDPEQFRAHAYWFIRWGGWIPALILVAAILIKIAGTPAGTILGLGFALAPVADMVRTTPARWRRSRGWQWRVAGAVALAYLPIIIAILA